MRRLEVFSIHGHANTSQQIYISICVNGDIYAHIYAYLDGVIHYKTTYKNHYMHGKMYNFYNNGNILCITNFIDGYVVSEYGFDINGMIVHEKLVTGGIGTVVSYNTDGTIIKTKYETADTD